MALRPFLPSGSTARGIPERYLPRPAPERLPPQIEAAASLANKRPAAKKDRIDEALKEGIVEVNIAALTRDDVEDFVAKLARVANKIKVLKLLSVPRGAGWSQYEHAAMNDQRMRGKRVYDSKWHKGGVAIASAHVQHAKVRFKLYAALLDILLRAPIAELELGMRLSPSGYKALACGLSHCATIQRLSFAGCHMGNEAVALLKDGLLDNRSLEELDFTGCSLTDDGVLCLGSIVKAHAKRRVSTVFTQHLREYPDAGLDPAMAAVHHHARMRSIAEEVDTVCGGWRYLELAENEITDYGARALYDALSFDRRLVMLSLRGNLLSSESESEFVELMREHRALVRVDLRQQLHPDGADMGILKLRKQLSPPRLTALGFQRRLGGGGGGAGSRQGRGGGAQSPTYTYTSQKLWELMEEQDTLTIGPTPCGSPRDGPSPIPRFTRSASLVSWGDRQLVAADAAAGGGAAGRYSYYGHGQPFSPASILKRSSSPHATGDSQQPDWNGSSQDGAGRGSKEGTATRDGSGSGTHQQPPQQQQRPGSMLTDVSAMRSPVHGKQGRNRKGLSLFEPPSWSDEDGGGAASRSPRRPKSSKPRSRGARGTPARSRASAPAAAGAAGRAAQQRAGAAGKRSGRAASRKRCRALRSSNQPLAGSPAPAAREGGNFDQNEFGEQYDDAAAAARLRRQQQEAEAAAADAERHAAINEVAALLQQLEVTVSSLEYRRALRADDTAAEQRKEQRRQQQAAAEAAQAEEEREWVERYEAAYMQLLDAEVAAIQAHAATAARGATAAASSGAAGVDPPRARLSHAQLSRAAAAAAGAVAPAPAFRPVSAPAVQPHPAAAPYPAHGYAQQQQPQRQQQQQWSASDLRGVLEAAAAGGADIQQQLARWCDLCDDALMGVAAS